MSVCVSPCSLAFSLVSHRLSLLLLSAFLLLPPSQLCLPCSCLNPPQPSCPPLSTFYLFIPVFTILRLSCCPHSFLDLSLPLSHPLLVPLLCSSPPQAFPPFFPYVTTFSPSTYLFVCSTLLLENIHENVMCI